MNREERALVVNKSLIPIKPNKTPNPDLNEYFYFADLTI